MPTEILTKMERDGAAWMKISAHLEAELARCRAMNDGDLTERSTQRLRGYIAALKDFKLLGTDRPVVVNDNLIFRD